MVQFMQKTKNKKDSKTMRKKNDSFYNVRRQGHHEIWNIQSEIYNVASSLYINVQSSNRNQHNWIVTLIMRKNGLWEK